MIRIQEAIVVEGRYDQNTLRQIVDAPIFVTNGFGIRKDPALAALLRRVAQKRGLIVLTDSDGGGLLIRNFLKSCIPPEQLKHAYIPDIPGKERRKAAPGKEGKLGVEGMRPAVLLEALRRCGATIEGESAPQSSGLTRQDLFELGLTGGADSAARRLCLQKKLGFPEKMSAKELFRALELLYTRQELAQMIRNL